MSPPAWLIVAALTGAASAASLTPLTHRLLRDQPTSPGWTSTLPTTLTVVVTAALFAALAWRSPTALVPAAWCLAAVALPLTVLDLAVRRLPDVLVGPAYGAAAFALTATAIHSGLWWPLLRAVVCSAIAGTAMLTLALARAGQLGLGDVKLAALTTLVTGAHSVTAAILALVGAFVAAAIIAVALLITGRVSGRSTRPFGPYLLAGALVTLLAVPL